MVELPERLLGATRLALTLAVLPPRFLATSDAWYTHRIVEDRSGGMDLRRIYTLGEEGPFGASREVFEALLGAHDLTDGDPFELHASFPEVAQLLAGLLDPEVDSIGRAAAEYEVAAEAVRDVLKDAGIDLVERTLLGTSWLNLPKGNSWRVSKVTDDGEGLSLRHARLLEPKAHPGDTFVFPVLEGLLPRVCELLPRAAAVPYEFEADAFDELKSIAAPVSTPSVLEPFGLGELRRMYPEGHGVLFAEVDGTLAEALWERLDAAAETTGFRPVLLAGSSSNWKWGWSHHLAWRQERTMPGVQKDAHPLDDPSTVLAAANTVDAEALLRPGGNPSYSDARPESGAWPDAVPTASGLRGLVDVETEEVCDHTLMALVPADFAWRALAFLPQLTLGGEATPALAQAVAVCRHWEERFGARVAVVDSATLEWVVARPPTERAAALALADAHYAFTPEGGSRVREERAAELMATRWHAYWD